MTGIVIITHCELGSALIDAAAFILGEKPREVEPISVDINENPEKLRRDIAKAIKKVDHHSGVLLLTDMFGGTPSNLGYSFLEEDRIEVLSGVNLPILIKAVNAREKMSLGELARTLEAYGRKSISLASGILKGEKRS
jgi:PTS system mannose-specific IIA component